MAFDIGVNVVEVDGAGAPSITSAAVSIGAFNVLTRRGVPNRPARVTSFPQFVDRFGTYFDHGLGAYLVKGFFDNGGRTAYVNRVIDPGAAVATRTLQDSAPANTLRIDAGSRGLADPGVWGNEVFIRVQHSSSADSQLEESSPASIDGTVNAATVDMSGFPTLSVKIDGQATATDLTFAAANFGNAALATLQEVVDAINAQTNLLTANVQGAAPGHVRITSTGELARTLDTFTSLEVTAANATLGFAVAAPVLGTVAAANLTVNGAKLHRVGDFRVGDALRVTDGATTQFTKLLTLDENTSEMTWAPPVAGPFPDLHKVVVSRAEFDLSIATPTGDGDHVVETWTFLSMEADLPNYAPRVINHTLRGSRYVRAVDLASATASGADRPANIAWLALGGGTEGTTTANHFIGDQASRTGFFAFDPYDVQLLCCERTDFAIATAALAYCANQGDCMFVGAVPDGYVAGGQAVAFGQSLQATKRYGALYGPWIVVPDPIGVGDTPRKTIPPVGHVMGVYARIANTRGIWKAPAGDEANLLGVLEVTDALSAADHTDLVVNGSVNGIRAIPGVGIVVDASRTLSTDPRWRYVNVRLLFNYVKSSLRDGLRWVRQEPNRDSLWDAIKFGSVNPFLTGLWRQGAFGTGTAEETFTVIVDETNNTPADVEQGRLTVEVYFYPSRPAETIVIKVGQQPSGGTASEA